ncbi:hypothetical protein D3C84_582860 [compost metagenome]
MALTQISGMGSDEFELYPITPDLPSSCQIQLLQYLSSLKCPFIMQLRFKLCISVWREGFSPAMIKAQAPARA